MPKYIHIKVNGNNAQSTHTKNAEVTCRVNQELKFLYKKSFGNEQLYASHLKNATDWWLGSDIYKS